MPLYKYECKAGHETERFYSLSQWREWIRCPVCRKRATISFAKRMQVHTFKSYIESNFTGDPIEITSRNQRDALCKKHRATYDSNKYHRKPKATCAVESTHFGEVKRAIDRGHLDDGTPIEQPVSGELPED